MANEWEFLKLPIYFSAFTANINGKCTFIFYFLYRQFEGALNGNNTSGVMMLFHLRYLKVQYPQTVWKHWDHANFYCRPKNTGLQCQLRLFVACVKLRVKMLESWAKDALVEIVEIWELNRNCGDLRIKKKLWWSEN